MTDAPGPIREEARAPPPVWPRAGLAYEAVSQPDPAVLRAAAILARRPGLAVPAVAAHVGLGERQLRRRFADGVGLGPKAFARVARFQRALALVRAGDALARVAADAGFADQAHLAHEVRALAGRPPASLA